MKKLDDVLDVQSIRMLDEIYGVAKSLMSASDDIDELFEPDLRQKTVMAACARYGMLDPYLAIILGSALLAYFSVAGNEGYSLDEKKVRINFLSKLFSMVKGVNLLDNFEMGMIDFAMGGLGSIVAKKLIEKSAKMGEECGGNMFEVFRDGRISLDVYDMMIKSLELAVSEMKIIKFEYSKFKKSNG